MLFAIKNGTLFHYRCALARWKVFLLQPNSDLKDKTGCLIGSMDEAAQSSFSVSVAVIEGMKECFLAHFLVKHSVRCCVLNFEMVAHWHVWVYQAGSRFFFWFLAIRLGQRAKSHTCSEALPLGWRGIEELETFGRMLAINTQMHAIKAHFRGDLRSMIHEEC